jgi:hypothetical protein
MQGQTTVEHIAQMVQKLSPSEKFELVKLIIVDIQSIITDKTPENPSLHSAYGICSDLQPVPSKEDITQMRKEIFSGFPREDI